MSVRHAGYFSKCLKDIRPDLSLLSKSRMQNISKVLEGGSTAISEYVQKLPRYYTQEFVQFICDEIQVD
jgi:hypothetical protein